MRKVAKESGRYLGDYVRRALAPTLRPAEVAVIGNLLSNKWGLSRAMIEANARGSRSTCALTRPERRLPPAHGARDAHAAPRRRRDMPPSTTRVTRTRRTSDWATNATSRHGRKARCRHVQLAPFSAREGRT
jgi:hypothetical protein